MKIEVNNKGMTVESPCSLGQLTQQLQLPLHGIAVGVNNQLIPRTDWDNCLLQESDSVVIIKAACGG